MLSENHPEALKKTPANLFVKSFEHWDKNYLYDVLQEKEVRDDDDWAKLMTENFDLSDYDEWVESQEDKREAQLRSMLAYQTHDQMAKKLLDKVPTNKQNYLHVKIKRNPGHYA